MREEGFITAGAGAGGAARARPRIRPYPGRDRGARRLREGIPAAAVPRSVRRRPSARLGGAHDVRARAAGRGRARGRRRACGGSAIRTCRRRSSRSIPATGDILAMVGGRDFRESQFNRAWRSRGVSRGRRSSRFLFAAALEHGYSPVSVLDGPVDDRAAGARRVGAAQRQRRGPRRADAARGADRVEQPRGDAAAAAHRLAPVLRLASDVGLRDLPDVPSLSLGTGLVTPLDLTAAFAMFPNGGSAVQPRAPRRASSTQDGGVAFDNPARADRVIPDAGRLPDGVDARGRHRSRHRQPGAHRLRRALSGRRQDRHDRRFQGRLVRRLHVVDRRRRLGRARSAGADRPQRLRRALRAADLERLHARRGAQAAGRASSSRLPGMREEPLCKVSYLQPVEDCPTYTEYFKDGDQIPSRLCPIHQGT